MKTIKNFNLSRLLVAACIEFHDSVVSIISMVPALITALGDTFSDYKNEIAALKDAANKSIRLANTRAVTEKDKVRDALLRRLFKYVADFLKSPIESEQQAAQIINDVISRYRGLADYEMNKETGEIKNMLSALRPQEIVQATTALHLDGLLETIEDANYDFINEVTVRVDGESKKSKLNTREQRLATRAAFEKVTQKLNAISILTPTADSDNCIEKINSLIDVYDLTIVRMRAGGSGNEKLPKKEKTPEEEGEE